MQFWIGVFTGIVITLIFCSQALKGRICDGKQCKNNQITKVD